MWRGVAKGSFLFLSLSIVVWKVVRGCWPQINTHMTTCWYVIFFHKPTRNSRVTCSCSWRECQWLQRLFSHCSWVSEYNVWIEYNVGWIWRPDNWKGYGTTTASFIYLGGGWFPSPRAIRRRPTDKCISSYVHARNSRFRDSQDANLVSGVGEKKTHS